MQIIKESKDIKKIFQKRIIEFEKEEQKVKKIINSVKKQGDKSIINFTKQFDKVKLTSLKVSPEEIKMAYKKTDKSFITSFNRARINIEKFHKKEISEIKYKTWILKNEGVILGEKITPIQKLGIYIPAGLASYPSTVLMTVVPSKIAGVKEIIVCTPPSFDGTINPYTLVAINELGIKNIFKVGGVQAVASLAFGTESIPKVDKIVGPGNIYVNLAKKLVYGIIDIDMFSGPSEILILADKNANPEFIAADLISQAEHGAVAGLYPSSILITNSEKLAQNVNSAISNQLKNLSRNKIIIKSLKQNGKIIIVQNILEGIEIANEYAPEHLQIITKNPYGVLKKIKNAGAIFLGNYSPVALGDYFAGPSHVLPTSSTARFFSPLSVSDFIKKSSLISYSKSALSKVKNDIIKLAEIEGLSAHANAIKIRY